jgi:3-oxoacyl-[acyl-carrier protein] reductase
MATSTEKQRVAVITGGSGGIGRVTAQRLGADGMTVVVHYVGNSDHAEEVVKAVTEAGGQASAVTGAWTSS